MLQEAKPLSYAYPDSLKRTLKKGEYAVYQLVDVYYKDGKFSGRTAGIPNKDIVYDKEGNLTPIAFVEGYNPDGTPILGNIWFSIEAECMILCMSGAKHANLYNFLEVSNYNESNPNRDTNITPIYRKIDSMNVAKQTRDQRTVRVSALKAALAMSNEEILNFINTNSKEVPVRMVTTPDGKTDWEALRDGIERWAEQNPGKFLKLSESKAGSEDTIIESYVSAGMEKNVIGWDAETKSWYGANGKPFLTCKSVRDGAHRKDLIEYLKSGPGLKVLEKLKEAAK